MAHCRKIGLSQTINLANSSSKSANLALVVTFSTEPVDFETERNLTLKKIFKLMDLETIKKHVRASKLSLRVIPNSSRNELIEENGKLKLYLQAVPEDNKANQALIKFFKKEFGIRIELVSGMKSRDKVLIIN